jgi:hypothetical protein
MINKLMINQLIKDKLKFLKENPDKIKNYAGNIYHGMFRSCKKCRGKGIIDIVDNRNNIIGVFCSCVRNNIKKEFSNIEFEEVNNGTNIS